MGVSKVPFSTTLSFCVCFIFFSFLFPMNSESRRHMINYEPVGVRTMPRTGCTYLQRIPSPDPFRTSWYPVNASQRCVKDENIELINLHYSGTIKQQMKSPQNLLDKRAKLHSKQIVVPRIGGPDIAMWKTSSNSIWPFCTMEKPSCGYFFSRSTDNKKRLGIPSTNTVKWRNGELNHAILRNPAQNTVQPKKST